MAHPTDNLGHYFTPSRGPLLSRVDSSEAENNATGMRRPGGLHPQRNKSAPESIGRPKGEIPMELRLLESETERAAFEQSLTEARATKGSGFMEKRRSRLGRVHMAFADLWVVFDETSS